MNNIDLPLMFVSLTNIRPLRLRSTDWKSALRNEFVLQDNEYARNSHFKMKGYKCTKTRFEKKVKADQLIIYTTQLRSWTWDYWEQIQTVLGCKDLKQGPPGFKSSILKQLAMSHSRKCVFVSFPRNSNKNISLNIKCRIFVSEKPWLCYSIAKGYKFHTHDESGNCMHN